MFFLNSENCCPVVIAPNVVNFVLIWLANHDAANKEACQLASYPLPILMSLQGQVHTVVIQVEPALHLTTALGGGTPEQLAVLYRSPLRNLLP
jgi:hypothetical protein